MAGLPKPGFWGAMFGQTVSTSEGDRFTLEELRRLHSVLTEEKTVTGESESLRSAVSAISTVGTYA